MTEDEQEKKPNVDSWNDYVGDYLKPELVKEFPLNVAVKDLVSSFNAGKAQLAVKVEYLGRDWLINLNKTNQDLIRKNKKPAIKTPRELIGKKLTFDKTKVWNPALKQHVDGFIVDSLE